MRSTPNWSTRKAPKQRVSIPAGWGQHTMQSHPATRSMAIVQKHRLAALQGLDFFGGSPLRDEEAQRAAEWEREDSDARIVILADLWLDRPDTLPKLQRVLNGAHCLVVTKLNQSG